MINELIGTNCVGIYILRGDFMYTTKTTRTTASGKKYTITCHYPEKTPEEIERDNERHAKLLLGIKLDLMKHSEMN